MRTTEKDKGLVTESSEIDNVETSFQFCVVYVLNVHRLGPTKRRICRTPTSAHSLHLASSPVHTIHTLLLLGYPSCGYNLLTGTVFFSARHTCVLAWFRPWFCLSVCPSVKMVRYMHFMIDRPSSNLASRWSVASGWPMKDKFPLKGCELVTWRSTF